MANAIKKKEETNVVQFDPSMFEADANEGLGQLGQDDLAIPFLRILGDTSPQVKKRDPEYVDGAEVGMIFNSLTREVLTAKKVFKRYLVHTFDNTSNGKIEVKGRVLPKTYTRLTRIFCQKQHVTIREKIDYQTVIISKILPITLY